MKPRHYSRTVLTALALAACSLACNAQTQAATTLEQVRKGFLNPPDDARPMVRWWWFGAAVEKPELLRELQQMKADGIGGAELAFVYPEVVDDPSAGLKNLPFLSPEMLDAVNYAQAEGRKLGLRIDVTLCSGWPYGGPATTLDEAATKLRTIEVRLRAGETTVALPPLAEGEHYLAASVVNGEPKAWDAAGSQPLKLTAAGATVAASSSARTVLFFVMGHTKQKVKRAAVGAEGYVLDPFSHDAVATHLKAVGEPLVKAFGATPPYAIFSDSLEAYGADWTPNLPTEFLKRRGYNLLDHLPDLVGGGSVAADTVRHDYGRTLTELVNENYLTQINTWATAHSTKFRSQTYGEPAVSFSSQNLVALAEGEGPQWRAFSTLRWATSANHVFGHTVTSGETYTWLHSPVFRATPLDMKAEADVDFVMGENQLIFHGWPYSAPPGKVPEPGWSLYAAASFNDHNPWHPAMPAVTKYIARMSYLLRQGKPANQVAVLLPTDDAWASFSPGKVTVTGAMSKLISHELMAAILSAGYNVDYIDADAVNKVGLGDHQIVVIPPTVRIPVETLKNLHAWAKKDGLVLCLKQCPSLDPEGKPLSAMSGSFTVADDDAALVKDMKAVAAPDLGLLPPAEMVPALLNGIGFIRRKLPDGDVYFVTNTMNEPVRMLATFQTGYRNGVAVDPDSGAAKAFGPDGQRGMGYDLVLAPYESRVFFFGESAAVPDAATPQMLNDSRYPGKALADLSTDWRVTFTSTSKAINEHELLDWISESSTKNYSGEAVYTRDFTLASLPKTAVLLDVEGGMALPGAPNSVPQEHVTRGADGQPNPLVTGTGPGMHAYFEPPIREAALVTINGKAAGTLWHPPYVLDVTPLIKQGENHIEIRVYNTALNAWAALAPHDYKPLIAKYGDRFQMQDLDKVKPISSGILGTIHLVAQDKATQDTK